MVLARLWGYCNSLLSYLRGDSSEVRRYLELGRERSSLILPCEGLWENLEYYLPESPREFWLERARTVRRFERLKDLRDFRK